MEGVGNRAPAQNRREQLPVIQTDDEVREPKLDERVGDGRAQLGLHHRRGGPQGIDVALVELTKAPTGRPIRAPDWLNLITLEQPRQLALVLGHDPRQRHGQVVAKGQVRLPARFVLPALEDLENELAAGRAGPRPAAT